MGDAAGCRPPVRTRWSQAELTEDEVRDDLRRLVRAYGWGGNKWLAREIGVSPAYTCNMVHGKARVTPRIASRLGLTMSSTFSGGPRTFWRSG